ncbi:MAG: VOC family protein [Labilithrix sp.]|nr:VOC family protein [Labilithrix sp.]MCW5813237.1 VOC family protein [Labilithrix sp.]
MAARSIFVNLPVKDLEKTKAFFAKLGFTYNAQFTDQNAACLVVSELGYVMLLQEEFFKTFTKRPISNAHEQTEALFALSCESRAEVDALVRTALENGGSAAMPPQDHGFMYGASFYDLDGHHWEVLWMDPAHVQKS